MSDAETATNPHEGRENVNTKKPTTPPQPIRGHNLTAKLLRRKVWRAANVNDDWCMFVFVGREGSGKSHTCASICEKVDPSFGPERVFFEPENFLEFLNDIPSDERQGKAVMLDESGVGMGVRSWYDKTQIQLNKLLQTARDDNMIIGLTLPRLSELDSQTRGRLHGFCEMREVEPGDHAIFSWKTVSVTRDDRDKIYKKYPRMRNYGSVQRIRRFAIGPPSEEFVDGYEARKEAFKARLYEETLDEMGDGEEGSSDDMDDPHNVADAIMDDGWEQYVTEHPTNGSQYFDKDMIQLDYDLSFRKAKQVKKLLERKEEVTI